MPTEVLLPILGEAITEATLSRWLKKEGETVQRGEEIAELETSKATLPLECPTSGVLLKIIAPEGTVLETGQVIAVVGKPGEVWQPESSEPPTPAKPVPISIDSTQLAGDERVQRISPAARRRAAELGIPIEEISARDPSLRITTEDVERYAVARSTRLTNEYLPFHREPLNETRRLIAQRMTASQQVPQFSVSMDIIADALYQTLIHLNSSSQSPPVHFTVTTLLIYIAAQTLLKHRYLNSKFDGETVVIYDTIHLALAIATPRGLVAPVIPEAERMTLGQLAHRVRSLTERARAGKLLPEELRDGTFPLSNLGMYGVSQFIPLLNPPQVAILGIGAIQPGWVPLADGRGHPVRMMNVTVTADHRVVDGAQVALFLSDLREAILSLHSEQFSL